LISDGNLQVDKSVATQVLGERVAADDEVLVALRDVDAVLRENAERGNVLRVRIAEFRVARINGQGWAAILANEDRPGTLQLISLNLSQQSDASGYLRRSLAVALQAEGKSIPDIARLFGVTHQRISNLLRRVINLRKDEVDKRVT
jgi:hypothetical protein